MNGYVPIPMPVVMPSAGGGSLPLWAAWLVGALLLLMSLGLSFVSGYCAYLLWEDDLRFFSIVLWAISVVALVVLPTMVITGIFIPAYGATV